MYLYVNLHTQRLNIGTCREMIIVAGNGHSKLSSNP